VAYIGTSPERARGWEMHDNVRHTYPPASRRRDAIRATLLAIIPDIPQVERRIDEQELLYANLCMAKHGNPKALRHYGLAVAGKRARLYHGPFVADYVIRQGRFALYHAARMVALATMVFTAPLLPEAPERARRQYTRAQRAVARRIVTLSRQVPGRGNEAA